MIKYDGNTVGNYIITLSRNCEYLIGYLVRMSVYIRRKYTLLYIYYVDVDILMLMVFVVYTCVHHNIITYGPM